MPANPKLLSIENWNELFNRIDWYHSFLREAYFASHRYFKKTESGNVAESSPDSPYHTVRLAWSIVSRDDEKGLEGLELNCIDSVIMSPIDLEEEDPTLTFEEGERLPWVVTIPEKGLRISSRAIIYETFGEEFLGRRLRLGHEGPSDDCWVTAELLNENWRQCGNCGDAWEELSYIVYSACPNCEELTKIKGTKPIDPADEED